MASQTMLGVLGLHFGVLGVILALANVAGSAAYAFGVFSLPAALVFWVVGLIFIVFAMRETGSAG